MVKMTTSEIIDLSQLNDVTRRVMDIYGRSRGIYERTMAAMGRVPHFKVTMASTATVKIADVKHGTS
jgi:hypothetical protein